MSHQDPRPTLERFSGIAKLLELELSTISDPAIHAACQRIVDQTDAIREELDGLEEALRHHSAKTTTVAEELRPVEISTESIEATTVQFVMKRPEALRIWLWVLFASPTVGALMADLTIPTASELDGLGKSSNVARVLIPGCRHQVG